MHNAFYVFTLQTERTEKHKMKRNPSLECTVGTYDLFKPRKKGQNQMLGGGKR